MESIKEGVTINGSLYREHNMSLVRERVSYVWETYVHINEPEDAWFPQDKAQLPENPADYHGSGDSENDVLPHLYLNRSTNMGYPIDYSSYLFFDHTEIIIIDTFIFIICALGIVGNGTVIWVLGFRMKRNPFTTYTLNLAVADLAVLISLVSTSVFVAAIRSYNRSSILSLFFLLCIELFFFTYSASQFLLTAISIDRCVAILFPLWHRCHRPPHLSAIICAVIWTLSSLLSAIHFILRMVEEFGKSPLLYQLIVNALLCTPLMLISTLTLFIQGFCKSQQRQRRKLITVILLALLCFLIFAFPLNGFYIITYVYRPHPKLMVIGLSCACLNSSVNPVIYFLVGRRQKKGQTKASIKVALQRVFKDDKYNMEEEKSTSDSQF